MDILAFFAHPDDETMLCGGTLALLAARGVKVHVLLATRGEGGEMGEPPVCERPALGSVREQEAVCAARALGLASLSFLDYQDPVVGPDNTLYPFCDDLTTLAGQVALTIRQFAPAAVLSHGVNGEYGHPAHVLCHQATRLAVESFGERAPAFYTVQAGYAGHPKPHLINKDQEAHFVIDIHSVFERKVNAALCHRSQHALFVRRQSQEAGRTLTVPEVISGGESLHRVLPVVNRPADLSDPLAQVVEDMRVGTVNREQ